MALYRWPTDPKGKPAVHTKSWDAHQQALAAAKPVAPINAPAEAPVAAPGQVPMPPSPDFDAQLAELGAARDTTLTGLTGARTRTLGDYGFSEDAGGGLAFDPNNPFSKAALLKKNYDTSRRSTGQSMGSGGQLYAGAFQNAQDLVNRNQLGSEDALQKSLTAWLLENTDAATRARTRSEEGAGKIEGDRAAYAAASALYSPTVSAPNVAAPAAQGIGTAVRTSSPSSIKAGPGVQATKNTTVKKTKKGKTVTYSTSVKGP